MKTYTFNEIAEQFGNEIAEQALASNAEATCRLMNPGFENPAHLDKIEWACDPVTTQDGDTIQAYFYLTEEESADPESYGWDKDSAEFQLN